MSSTPKPLPLSATPYPDESFVGYVIRLTEINRYETPSWILQLAGLGSYHKVYVAFDEGIDLRGLIQLTRSKKEVIRSIRYSPLNPSKGKRDKFRDYYVHGHPVPRVVIKAHQPKVCVACLCEYGYVRTLWDLTAVTACPLHQCLLLDSCPHCRRRISFNRPRVSHCRCDFDWRESKPKLLEEAELEVTSLIYSYFYPAESHSFSHLRQLSLKDLIAVLFFFAGQYSAAQDPSDSPTQIVRLGRSMSNKTVHRFLCQAASVFRDWPKSYFSFLQSRIENLGPSREVMSVQKAFGSHWDTLLRRFKSPCFDFLRVAFEEFITQKWDRNHTSQLVRLSQHVRNNKRFLSKGEAHASLGVSRGMINRLLKKGKLNAVTRQNRLSGIFLIEAAEVNELRRQRDALLDLKRTASRLGLSSDQTRALTQAKLLMPKQATELRRGVCYSIAEIDALLARVIGNLRTRPRSRGKTLSFLQALRQLRSRRVKLSEFLVSIVKGQMQPCGIAHEVGFKALLFRQQDLNHFVSGSPKWRKPNSSNITAASKALNVRRDVVHFLAQHNFVVSNGNRWRLRIEPSSVIDFSRRYVLLLALAKSLRTSTPLLAILLETQGVKPIEGTQVKGARYFVYLKADIDLHKLKTQLLQTRRSSKSLDFKSAAEFLKIEPKTMSQLVMNGVIRRSVKNKKFVIGHLRRFFGRVESYMALLSARVAAHLCGISVRNCRETLTTSCSLTPIHVEGDAATYFRKAEVDGFVQQTKSLVRSADVRSRLGIGRSQLFRLIKSGELNPIAGPDIDGSVTNRFLKSEVEELRTQRQLFKRHRAREGGSQRFGKPAGPKRSPVIETIAARVNELLLIAKAEGVRLSGIKIHQVLLKEGYKVGINSVYVYLRRNESYGL
jgi:predicted DNA-binding transcriptional regulator AlpA